MALNRYMHSRNIYKNPPDFAKLANCYSEFSNIAKVDVTGKVTIDFKDPHTLRILTKCLLKSDFNLDVDIPEDRLVPTLPLRLNYILWIEDILMALKKEGDIWGLDIGTGACAIYPLLAATQYKWHMVGSETDNDSILKAQENIQRNNLQGLITLKKNCTSSVIEHLFSENYEQVFDFSMCNPPFYSSIQELCESRSPARLPPKNGFTGSPQELITEGGELQFCRKLINESKNHKQRVLIYTTMVGHKYNLKELLQDLKAEGIRHTHTEFCQGRVTRWGLAWTYQDYDIYNLVPPREQSRKKNVPMVYILPQLPEHPYNMETITNKLKSMLNNLEIVYKVINKRGNTIVLNVTAATNTWSNQRRKRRLMKKLEQSEAKRLKFCTEDTPSSSSSDSLVKDQTCDLSDAKQLSTATKSSQNNATESIYKNNEVIHTTEPVVHATLKVQKKDDNVQMEMEYLNGSAGKEGLHQIVQYIKNNWK